MRTLRRRRQRQHHDEGFADHGLPLYAPPSCAVHPFTAHVQLTERTGKKHKKGMAIGVGVMCVSMLSCSMSMGSDPSMFCFVWPAGFLVGLGIYLSAGVKSWWHHG